MGQKYYSQLFNRTFIELTPGPQFLKQLAAVDWFLSQALLTKKIFDFFGVF